MSSHLVYIAGPIDQVKAENSAVLLWRSRARARLERHAAAFYDPSRAFSAPAGGPGYPAIQKINREAIASSTAMLALLPAGVPTVGTPMEMIEARWAGKPVAVVCDAPGQALADWDVFSEPEGAVNWLMAQPLPDPRRALPVQVTSTTGALPIRHYADDAGIDLIVSESVLIEPHAMADVPASIAVAIDEAAWGLIVGRSSALRKRGILVMTSVIDAGYRGELFAMCQSMRDEAVKIEAGDRVAQLILLPNLTREFWPVEAGTLPPSARGTNGFGSTDTAT